MRKSKKCDLEHNEFYFLSKRKYLVLISYSQEHLTQAGKLSITNDVENMFDQVECHYLRD